LLYIRLNNSNNNINGRPTELGDDEEMERQRPRRCSVQSGGGGNGGVGGGEVVKRE